MCLSVVNVVKSVSQYKFRTGSYSLSINIVVLLQYFVIPIPSEHWCRIPVNISSVQDELALLPPSNTNSPVYSQCRMYDLNYSAFEDYEALSSSINASRANLTTTQCQHGWNFDKSVYHNTIATDWDLVCGKDYLPTLSYSLTSIGGAIGIGAGDAWRTILDEELPTSWRSSSWSFSVRSRHSHQPSIPTFLPPY